MIDVRNIQYGWLTFLLKSETSQVHFVVSYLTDFIEEIDYLLDFNFEDNDMDSKAIDLDGEGTNLYLCSYKYVYDDEFFIMVRRDREMPSLMGFNYKKFKENWESTKKKIMKDYNENFDLRCKDE